MKHLVGEQGLVVPHGYVTAVDSAGHELVYQQGQFIPPGWTITQIEGDGPNERSAERCAELLGIGGKAKTGGKGPSPVESPPAETAGD